VNRFFGNPVFGSSATENRKLKPDNQTMEEKIGDVTHYFGHIPAGIIKLTGSLKIGDKVRFKGATTDFEQEITSMQINREDIKEAKAGDEVGVEVKNRVREGDEVFLVI